MHGDARPVPRRTHRVTGALAAVAVLVAGFVATLGAPADAETAGVPPPEAFILVDAHTGAIITARNVHEALPPASTVKIMTALGAVERLPPTARIPVSTNAANREAMKIGMQVGTRWSFTDAMASLMMVSANDSAYALAERVGGSVKGFAADLNSMAHRYGMRDSTFGDPAGLSDGTAYDGGPKVSAYDLAIAARNALTVPAIAHWADTKSYEFTDPTGMHHQLDNHNKFLPDNGFGYVGANGFKTGYTEAAQHSLVATAKRGGRQCIAVILGSSDSGYTWAASLLDQCWKKPAVATTGAKLPPIAVSPYATRAAAKSGFTNLAVGQAKLAVKSTPAKAATPTAPVAQTNSNSNRGASKLAAATDATTTPASTETHHKPGLLAPSRLIWWFLLIAAVAVFLRRRAVKKQRARRIARQRARAKAMRSGSLPVVDGRYRTGMRIGPPLESGVQVERTYVDLTELERAEAEGRRASDFGVV
jgi:serine-type D-Ala-D-Ala carboxypeptidase (penicillin-binding protein 5/6)